jgi:signal transduction histidine kinase
VAVVAPPLPAAVEREDRIADLVYAGVAALAATAAALESGFHPTVVVCLILALVPFVLVVLRREPPLAVFAAATLLPVLVIALVWGLGVALFVGTAAASRVAARTDRTGLVAGVTLVAVALPFTPPLTGHDPQLGALYFAFGNLFGVLVGVLLRRTSELTRRLRAADAQLQEAGAREERHRLARDVHDLVAHSLTVVVLHIGGARRILRTDPGAAESALADAERVCRESLDGIRGVVGLLRDDGSRRGPGLDLAELVETYRSAGRPAQLTVQGDPDALPLLTRGTLHRVVQEALANAARYAPAGTPVAVEVAVTDVAVTARIENRLPSSAATAGGAGGYGLIGLREQVAAVGGELTSGPEGATWTVRCRLPIPAAPSRPAPGPRERPLRPLP